MKKVISRVW